MKFAEQIMAEAVRASIRVQPKVSFLEWGPANIRDEHGKFAFRPYQELIAADLFNPGVHSDSLCWYSGAGKTFLFAAAMAYAFDQLKLEVATQFPSKSIAEKWLRKKLKPFLDNTPALRDLGVIRSVADEMTFLNGASLDVTGANSGGVTRTVEVHWTNAEEIDAYTEEASDEGDKLGNFEKRSRGRGLVVKTRSAYPSVKGESAIEASIANSDGCLWFYECAACGVPQNFRWRNIKYAKGRPETAVMECPGCAGTFGDADRQASVKQTGHWVNRDGERVEPGSTPSEKYGRDRGTTLDCAAHVGGFDPSRKDYLHAVAAEIDEIPNKKNPVKAKRTFLNTMGAESYEPEFFEVQEASELVKRRKSVESPELPDDVAGIFLGLDPNKNFLAVQVWGAGEKDYYPLLYQEIAGRYDRPEVWRRAREIMQMRWRHPLGVDLRVWLGCWDSKFKPDTVYKYAKAYGSRVLCTKGSPTLGAPPIGTKQRRPKEGVVTLPTGPNELKAEVYEALNPDDPSRQPTLIYRDYRDPDGFEMFPEEYFAGLTIEDRSEVKLGNEMVPKFEHNDKTVRNEPLDTAGLCIAAIKASKFDHAKAMEVIEERAAEANHVPEHKPVTTDDIERLASTHRRGKYL